MFDANKTRVIGLPYGEKLRQYVKPFSSNTGTSRTDERADRRTDRSAISISRVSVLMRDKNVNDWSSFYETKTKTIAMDKNKIK